MRRSSQLGDQELESADLGFEFGYAKLFIRYGVLLEGLPAVVGGGSDPGLAAGMVDVQAGVEIGLEVAEDSRDLVRSGSFSHESLPGSLPVVRFPLRLDQVFGGRPGPWPDSSMVSPSHPAGPSWCQCGGRCRLLRNAKIRRAGRAVETSSPVERSLLTVRRTVREGRGRLPC